MRQLLFAAVLLAAPAVAADVPKTRTPIAGPEQGQDSGDARDIIALIDRLSQAIQARDTATLNSIVMPEGIVVDARENLDGSGKIGRHTLGEWVGLIGAIKQPIEERIGRPDLTIAGPAAAAAAPYTFYMDGKIHHCGTDFFQFVRDGGKWKIAAITYNATTEGCTAP